MVLTNFYRTSKLWNQERLLNRLKSLVPRIRSISYEGCFYVQSSAELTMLEQKNLRQLLQEDSEPNLLTDATQLVRGEVWEFGPRLSRITPDSTNIVSICAASGLNKVTRVEMARRYRINVRGRLAPKERLLLVSELHDRMTEEAYLAPLENFGTEDLPEPVMELNTLNGTDGLLEYSRKVGLGLTQVAAQFLHELSKKIRRNLTNVEVYNFATLNSDHSRHITFARTRWLRDGKELPFTLMDFIRLTHQRNPGRTLVAFSDNASVSEGFDVLAFEPSIPSELSPYEVKYATRHLTYKMESHNHPSAIEPYEGGATCTGGLFRDMYSVGLGGEVLGAVTQICTSHVKLPGNYRPWLFYRSTSPQYQSALSILTRATSGMFDFGNQVGVPVIAGTCREFRLNIGVEKFGFDKPWVTGGAVGIIDGRHTYKAEQKAGDLIVLLGGDAYPIGMGGAVASSVAGGSLSAKLDFNSVQRGNGEMEQIVSRVIKACIAMGVKIPIVDIQDLGAGGTCSAVTELVQRLGGKVYLRKIPSGDHTMSVVVLWCNEAQERVVLIIRPESLELLKKIAKRESCPMAVIGEVDGSKELQLIDEQAPESDRVRRYPVHLPMPDLLGNLPMVTRELTEVSRTLQPLHLPANLTIAKALQRVLRLDSVGSKQFLVDKVDRSVTGKVVQQPTVGRLQLPVADVGVVALSLDGFTAGAVALGECPVSWLVSPEASVRMSVAEALTNLAAVRILGLSSVSFSGNWGVAANVPGEAMRLYNAVEAVQKFLDELRGSFNVGKDSTSLEARFTAGGKEQRVVSPGTFTASAFAPVPDFNVRATPDLKKPGKTKLLFIDLARGSIRLGASALAQCWGQVGDNVPDVVNTAILIQGFTAVQKLMERKLILSLHDRSDGGLLVTALEMAFSGDCGISLNLTGPNDSNGLFGTCFAQELGWVMEYELKNEQIIEGILRRAGLAGCIHRIGLTTSEPNIVVRYNGQVKFSEHQSEVRDWWHETAYRVDCEQANPETAAEQRAQLRKSAGLSYELTFKPRPPRKRLLTGRRPKLAILRGEGTNGDVEMARAYEYVGFETVDVNVTDLMHTSATLEPFAGATLCGGFSYKDVLAAGRGLAYALNGNCAAKYKLSAFAKRQDTFMFGICNGFQILEQLGVIRELGGKEVQPRLVRNIAEKFVSRLVMVRVEPSPSIFFKNMEGSTFVVWTAHAEGRQYFPNPEAAQQLIDRKLVPVRYVDENHQPTEVFPHNPSGSPLGIASFTSSDGRFFGMMPHPERSFLQWQLPFIPLELSKLKASPCLQIFVNAREWCERNK